MSVLLYGANGTGKTSIAADFAKMSKFPYVKFISETNFLGLRANEKGDKIRAVFEDAYKSKESFIVIDCIEMLV
jgi:SpoVK/Ycf46/Vps4 family AAA+-type ATPase